MIKDFLVEFAGIIKNIESWPQFLAVLVVAVLLLIGYIFYNERIVRVTHSKERDALNKEIIDSRVSGRDELRKEFNEEHKRIIHFIQIDMLRKNRLSMLLRDKYEDEKKSTKRDYCKDVIDTINQSFDNLKYEITQKHQLDVESLSKDFQCNIAKKSDKKCPKLQAIKEANIKSYETELTGAMYDAKQKAIGLAEDGVFLKLESDRLNIWITDQNKELNSMVWNKIMDRFPYGLISYPDYKRGTLDTTFVIWSTIIHTIISIKHSESTALNNLKTDYEQSLNDLFEKEE